MSTPASHVRTDLNIVRVRHAVKLRTCRVSKVVTLTPRLLRITLTGEELCGFESQSFDDHVKVFFPEDGTEQLTLPMQGANGASPAPGAPRPIARDFTPRRYASNLGELDLEFVLHETGPATRWAAQARPGSTLGIGGPRGSMVIPTAFDWHLLVGDATALPAIGRRVEELPAGVRAIVIIEVDDPSDEVRFDSHAQLDVTWCHRARDLTLMTHLKSIATLPAGEGYAWAAAESSSIREIRQHLMSCGMDKSRIRAAAYWKRGATATHEVLDD